MSNNIHQNDVGTIFKVKIIDDNTLAAIDVSTATTKKIKFRKPPNVQVIKTAEFTTDGSDGYIQYTTIDGDLDRTGLWKIQGFVEGATYKNSSEVDTFTVLKNN